MDQNIDLDVTISVCANEVYRRFREYVDRSDLVQEGQLWALAHPKRVSEYIEDEDVKRGRYRLRRDVMTPMERFARSEKSQRLGYEPEDEQFFDEKSISVDLFGKLLEWSVTGLPYQYQATGESPQGKTRGLSLEGKDGKDLHCMVLDVQVAIGKALTADESQILWDYYAAGYSEQEIGDGLGVSQSTISRRISRYRSRVAAHLGGSNPWRGFNPEPEENRPGVHSNRSGVNQHVR
jgi:DNA-directed RNA polymerase specialized sigma subunit